MNNRILILIPSLNRVNNLCDALASVLKHSTGMADALVLCGTGGITTVLNSVPMSLIEKYEVVGISGDDVRYHTNGWDQILLATMNGRVGCVYGRDDIQNHALPTHPFISSAIIKALGFIQPSELGHFYGDNFYQELLGPLDRIWYEPSIHTEHLHFTVGKSPHDQTYADGYESWNRDTATWGEYRVTKLKSDIERVRSVL